MKEILYINQSEPQSTVIVYNRNMSLIKYVQQDRENSINVKKEVDALVLAQSSYYSFENLASQLNDGPLYVKDLNVDLVSKSINHPLIKSHIELMTAMRESPVFGQVKILDFESRLSMDKELQFAAITYLVNNKELFIAFRGTDLSTVGWKENFNMSYSKNVPAQRLASDYINKVMNLYEYPTFIGGHSKGGNLAVYGAAFCDKDYQTRIQKVYNFDGPGFRSEIIEDESYINVLDKVTKYIPRASIVGLFLDSKETTKVVESTSFSLFQHDAYTWKIVDNQFVYKEQPTNLSLHFSKSVSDWLEEIDDEKRKYVIEGVFDVLNALDITSFDDLPKLNFTNISHTLAEYNNVDPEFKAFLKEIIWSFIKAMFDLRKDA